jgi:hypothetical protein
MHLPKEHSPDTQSEFALHLLSSTHFPHTLPPQSTSVSLTFLMLLLHLSSEHLLFKQILLRHSEFAVQFTPISHVPETLHSISIQSGSKPDAQSESQSLSSLGKQQLSPEEVQLSQSASKFTAQSGSQTSSDSLEQQLSSLIRQSAPQLTSSDKQKVQYASSAHSPFVHTFLEIVSHSPSAQVIVQSLSPEEQ